MELFLNIDRKLFLGSGQSYVHFFKLWKREVNFTNMVLMVLVLMAVVMEEEEQDEFESRDDRSYHGHVVYEK